MTNGIAHEKQENCLTKNKRQTYTKIIHTLLSIKQQSVSKNYTSENKSPFIFRNDFEKIPKTASFRPRTTL
jgi:hypothetical protein